MNATSRSVQTRIVHLPRRVVMRHRSQAVLEGHLRAYDQLLRRATEAAPALFAHSLEHLARHLKVKAILLARPVGDRWTAPWQFPEDSLRPPEAPCRWVMDYPGRTLVVRDARHDDRWGGHPDLRGLGALAAVGVWEGGSSGAVLLAVADQPRTFTRPELAMLHAVAGLLGKALEVEALKVDLHRVQEALALTEAVVADSALQDAPSGLPNRRYLEIWLKANLYLARRRGEGMAVVRWTQPPKELKLLRAVAEGLRGEDLMICEGKGRCLLLLPRTPKGGAQILVHRLRQKLGDLPMTATLWDPETDDLQLKSVRTRLDEALPEAQALPKTVAWRG
ncbi:MAG TPA: hypothetical protein VJ570_01040 [Holophagaceae bacterium]|nr:hypothetical protein [Holophagaceae bacterium]